MTAPNHNRRTELLDVRESRAALPFEVRTDGDTLTLTGYASTFEPYEMYGGPAAGGWIEQIDKHAFDKTLREKPDLMLMVNHGGLPLARTKSGNLQLSCDDHGLKVVAQLDRNDPDVQRIAPKMRRGDLNEMSFAFRVCSQTWSAAPGFDNDPQSLRTIKEVNIHKGDVSVVNYGANANTTAELLARRKRKDENGMKRTLSVAEANAIVMVDEKKRRPTRVTLSLVEATAIAGQQQSNSAASDAIITRALDILDLHGLTASTPPTALEELIHRHAGRDPLFGAALVPPMGEAFAAAARDRQRQANADALTEIDRQREAIINPQKSGWPHLSNSMVKKR